ncbi:MAG: LLM class flavin-dependent oxidoreductase [Actinomycetota bacterium]
MADGMRVGIVQMPVDPWDTTANRARELEALGFDHLWIYDHLTWRHYRDGPWHAALPWLTGLAAATERIELGTLVATPNLRHPVMLAKEAMSIDHVAGGRFVLGLGAGATGFDAVAFGDEPLPPGQRADRFEEYVTVLDGLLRGEVTNHAGRWYSAEEARVLPGCIRSPRVPLAVAAGGPRLTGLAASVADRWITLGDPATPPPSIDAFFEVLTDQAATLDRACDAANRDRAAVERLLFVSASNPAPLADLATFTEVAERAAALGFTDVVIHDPRPDDPALAFDPDLIPAIAAWRNGH